MSDDFILQNDGISLGDITVRLAQNDREIECAQRLRFKVFYEEFHATPSGDVAAQKRDFDDFDGFADHLVVVNNAIDDPDSKIVGTYRMLRQEKANEVGRFYTSDEFDISKLLKNYDGLLEMGRSCVLAEYRTKAVLQLLWQGIAEYVVYHDVQFLFGCASFHGTNPDDFKNELSFLYHNHLAPDDFRPVALPDLYTDMNLLPPNEIDGRQVMRGLPPLVKGYIRLGGFVADGAFIDHGFNTIDVCVIVKTSMITESYLKHYERKTGAEIERDA